MMPSHIRAKHRIPAARMAEWTGLSEEQLLRLERTRVHDWTVHQLHTYCTALGYRLRVVAERSDGPDCEITL